MNALRGVLTSFRTVHALEGLGVVGTSGIEHASRAAQHTAFARCCQHTHASAGQANHYHFALITARLHTSASASTAAAAKQVPIFQQHVRHCKQHRTVHQKAWSFIQQHTYRTQSASKSMWQRDYYSSPYSRSYGSAWDGDKVLYGLIAANCAGYFLWQSSPGLMSKQATVSINSIREGRIHTLLTSAFSHASLNHLFANMFTFYFFGRQIGGTFGGKKVS